MANGPSFEGSPYSTAISAPLGTEGGAAAQRTSWGVTIVAEVCAVWAPAGGAVPARIRTAAAASAFFVTNSMGTSLMRPPPAVRPIERRRSDHYISGKPTLFGGGKHTET